MSATVRSDGTVIQHIGRSAELEQVTAEDVKDPERLARALNAIQVEVARNAAATAQEWVEFEDVSSSLGTNISIRHNLGGRVRWAVVQWEPTSANGYNPFEQHADTDANNLVLSCNEDGTATVRIWRAD